MGFCSGRFSRIWKKKEVNEDELKATVEGANADNDNKD